MESEKDALSFCHEHKINYHAFSFALRSPDHMPQLAAMIYREILNAKSGGKTDRGVWGRIYYGCMRSGVFCDMNQSKFRDVLLSAYDFDAPAETSYFDGIAKVKAALLRKVGTPEGQFAFDSISISAEGIARTIRAIYPEYSGQVRE